MSYPNIINDINELDLKKIDSNGGIIEHTLVSKAGHVIYSNIDTGEISFFGGKSYASGAGIMLYGVNHSTNGGAFVLNSRRTDGSATTLYGKDDVLRWGGILDVTHIRNLNNNSFKDIYGGTTHQNGAQLTLFGKDYSNNPGAFQITCYANNSSGNLEASALFGNPSGTLNWRGNPVLTRTHILEYGNMYARKYSDGWIEQGGVSNVSAGNTTISYLMPFSRIIFTAQVSVWGHSGGDNNMVTMIRGISLTSINPSFWDSDTTASRSGSIAWYVCGY